MKAWTCHGRSQVELVDKLRQASIVVSPEVQKVMERVDRRYFCPKHPYKDAPQPIGWGQTISAPHMHAHVLEEMLPYLKKQQQQQQQSRSTSNTVSILDVGCGSGYLTACLGELVHCEENSDEDSDSSPSTSILGQSGVVYGIDVWPHLVERSAQNIRDCNPSLLESQTIQLGIGDGWKGLSSKNLQQQELQFDAIHVGAAAAEFPEPLLMQLKVGGVLIIPVGPEKSIQTLYRVVRVQQQQQQQQQQQSLSSSPSFRREDFLFQELFGVRYVPLIHP